MPTANSAGHFLSFVRPKWPARSIISFSLLLASLAMVLVVLWPLSARAAVYNPFIMVLDQKTEGKPNQTIVRFEVEKGAPGHLVRGGSFVPAEIHSKVVGATRARNRAAVREIVKQAGWNWFSGSVGWVGNAGTFAEHALAITTLEKFNGTMTNLGALLTGVQVMIDLSQGDNQQAGIDAFKGTLGFLIGKFGTAALQIANIGVVMIDQSLNEFGTTAWAEREQAWRYVYQQYYDEHFGGARTKGVSTIDLKERFEAIEARTDGGRSLDDWSVISAFYLKNTKTARQFKALLHADIEIYVNKFWDSPNFTEYASDGGWSTAGLARATSLTKEIQANLNAEHSGVLWMVLATRVLPAVQRVLIRETLQAQAAKLTKSLKDTLNQKMTIEVSAYNLTEPTRIEFMLPNGGSWRGTLKPGKSLKARITKIAFIKAGFPDTIVLHGPDGDQQKTFAIADDEAVVVFGTPKVDQIVDLSREESPLSCTVTVTEQDGHMETSTETRPAPSATRLQQGINGIGGLILGQFSPEEGWQAASPGIFEAGQMRLGAPYFEDIHSLNAPKMVETKGDLFGAFADQKYTVSRVTRHKGEFGELHKAECTSTMTLTVQGFFAEVEGKMTYVPLDRDQMQTIEDSYGNARDIVENLPGGDAIELPDLQKFVLGQ